MKLRTKQYLLARVRRGKTAYFYGEKLGPLVMANVRVGDKFAYAPLERGKWSPGRRESETTYSTVKA